MEQVAMLVEGTPSYIEFVCAREIYTSLQEHLLCSTWGWEAESGRTSSAATRWCCYRIRSEGQAQKLTSFYLIGSGRSSSAASRWCCYRIRSEGQGQKLISFYL